MWNKFFRCFCSKRKVIKEENLHLKQTPSAIASGVQSLPGAFGYGSLQTNTICYFLVFLDFLDFLNFLIFLDFLDFLPPSLDDLFSS